METKNALGFPIEMQKRIGFCDKINSKLITEYPHIPDFTLHLPMIYRMENQQFLNF